jgi:hypothetical protein
LRLAAPKEVGAMRELSERPNGEDAERAYQRLKGPARLKARRWFATLTEADLEEVYRSAWLSVCQRPLLLGGGAKPPDANP